MSKAEDVVGDTVHCCVVLYGFRDFYFVTLLLIY